MRFAAHTAHVPLARRWVVSRAAECGAPEDALRVVALLTSELVTNAVKHGPSDGQVCVAVDVRGSVLRVTVHDESPAPPRVLDPAPSALSGRGVMLVDRLAATWGVDERPGTGAGKAVWFEVAT